MTDAELFKTLTDEQKLIVQNANRIQVERKGKSLSRSQLILVNQARDIMERARNPNKHPEWVKSVDEIVRYANINNDKLAKMKRMKGFPKKSPHKGYNLSDILKFIELNEYNDESDKSARDRKTEKEIELLDIKIKNAKAELIEVSKVDGILSQHAAIFKARLYTIAETLPMQIQGMNVGECRNLILQEISSICADMQKSIERLNVSSL